MWFLMILCNSSISLYFQQNAICNPLIYIHSIFRFNTYLRFSESQLQLPLGTSSLSSSSSSSASLFLSRFLQLYLLFPINSIILLFCFMLLFIWLLRDQTIHEKKEEKTRIHDIQREESNENRVWTECWERSCERAIKVIIHNT